ncbi:MAG: hypothetical protein KKH77_07075 [Candidatus Omnitrophica bacterium]|nr:hypothetical protein [Candidatus Omnitrophota bacterium]MBU1808141.1 hypothetical protein [Candidatus Omnitrophota bacterium]
MNIFDTVYAIMNPAQLGIQAGASTAKQILPEPEWILTPYTEERMKQIDPAKYQQLVKEYGTLQADTRGAYAQALNPIPALSDISKYVLIGVVAVAVIVLFIKKGK